MMGSFAAIIAVAKRELGSAVSRQVHVATAYGLVGLCSAGLAVMAFVSLHRFVAREAGPFYADAVVSAVFLAVLIAALLYARAERTRRRTPTEIRERIMLAAPAAARVAMSKPKLALAGLAVAALLGVLTGRSIGSDRR